MKRIFRLSISKQMILTYLAACLIPLILVGVLICQVAISELESKTEKQVEAFHSQIVANLNQFIDDYQAFTLSVLSENQVLDYMNGEVYSITNLASARTDLKRILFRLVEQKEEIKSASLFNVNGEYLQSGRDGRNINYSVLKDKPWISGLAEMEEMFCVVPMHNDDYFDRMREQSVTVIRKIAAGGVTYKGALILDVNPSSIINLSENFKSAKEQYDIRIQIVDSQNRIFYDTGNIDMEKAHPYLLMEEIGEDYLVFQESSNELGFTVYTTVPMSSLNEVTENIRNVTIICAFLCIGLIVLFSIILSRAFTKPIYELGDGFKQLEHGDYVELAHTNRQDEIGDLLRNYNHMVVRMKQMVEQVYVSELRKKDAQFMALQTQINPHMLFNTLESIRMRAAMSGADDAEIMVQLLAKMFRSVLNRNEKDHTVADEITYVMAYMELQKYRRSGNYNLVVDLQEGIETASCISILFQPIVENSIKYAKSANKNNLNMKLKGRYTEDQKYIIFELNDDGKGMTAERLAQVQDSLRQCREEEDIFPNEISNSESSNIGLVNIVKRLQLYYGEHSNLEIIKSDASGTKIQVMIPYVKEADSSDE